MFRGPPPPALPRERFIFPKIHLRLFSRNNLARQKFLNLKKYKNNLKKVIFTLVSKGIFGGVLKITSENKK